MSNSNSSSRNFAPSPSVAILPFRHRLRKDGLQQHEIEASFGWETEHSRTSASDESLEGDGSDVSRCSEDGANEIGGVLGAQLLHDIGAVIFDGARADSKVPARLLVGSS